MQFLWKYIDDLVGKGLEFTIIGELLFYISLSLVPMALPLAILLASLMTFGNLGENYELLSLKSAGISLQKTMQSLIIFTILVSIGAFFFANNVLPVANLKSRSLLWDVQRQKPDLQIKKGVFNSLSGFSIRVEEKDPETNLLKKVRIYDHTGKEGNISVTVADSGYMKMTEDEKSLLVILYNGYSYKEEIENKRKNSKDRTYPHRREEFKEQRFTIELTGFGLNRSDESLYKSGFAMLNLNQLKYFHDSISEELINVHEKYNENLIKSSYFKKREIRDKEVKATIENSRKKRTGNINDKVRNVVANDTAGVVRKDTIAETSTEIQENITYNFYETFDTLENNMKSAVLYEALSNARDAKSYIKNNNVNLSSYQRKIARYKIEWYRKFTLSFACFIFFFIGAPLGAIIRKGGLGMPVIISVLFFIIYYIITITTEKLAKEVIITPFWGMWIASMILLPAGMFLTYKATTDSVILSVDTYTAFFKKIFNIKARNLSDTETLSTKIFDEKLPPRETITQISEFNTRCEDFYIQTVEELIFNNIYNNKISVYKNDLDDYVKKYYEFYNLLTIQDYLESKHIRSLARELPALEATEFNFLFIKKNLGILLTLFFPLGLIYYFLFVFKLRSLKRRLYKISELTKNIYKSIEDIKEYQEILYETSHA